MKKHRGSGHKGGVGMGGTGKRADSKKPSIWKDPKYFGRHGFKYHGVKIQVNSINVLFLEENLNILLQKNLVKKENDTYTVNLKDLGYNKLLGKGKLTKKFRINTKFASKGAIEAVKNAGGEIILPTIKENVEKI